MPVSTSVINSMRVRSSLAGLSGTKASSSTRLSAVPTTRNHSAVRKPWSSRSQPDRNGPPSATGPTPPPMNPLAGPTRRRGNTSLVTQVGGADNRTLGVERLAPERRVLRTSRTCSDRRQQACSTPQAVRPR
ncbi:hypothetical protein G3I71_42490 [Streptomyces sp. SID12501]|uniref:Uncharacterized protein n=1 Tax=Streptomyces sp. SID12501 TaxID=2706042 RepID=A0A6B3C7I2_9ACTN|nr:hypothetical protein [Streptomyces sp. SID12501]NEC92292.1 hypothetical protein [Streptomyces sp. SID12501]